MAGMPTGDFDHDEDFYEEDEPVERVLEAFEHGIGGVTALPDRVEMDAGPSETLVMRASSAGSRSHVSYGAAARRPTPLRSPELAVAIAA